MLKTTNVKLKTNNVIDFIYINNANNQIKLFSKKITNYNFNITHKRRNYKNK